MDLGEVRPEITVLISVLVGALVAELRGVLQGGRAWRAALRVLLYELLELRFQIVIRNPQELVGFLMEMGYGFDDGSLHRAVESILEEVESNRSSEDLDSQYKRAVDALAPHDPVFAYRLRNQSDLVEMEGRVRSYYRRILEIVPDGGPEVAELAHAESVTLQVARKEALARRFEE